MQLPGRAGVARRGHAHSHGLNTSGLAPVAGPHSADLPSLAICPDAPRAVCGFFPLFFLSSKQSFINLFFSPKNNLQLRGEKSSMKAESPPFVSAGSPRSLGLGVSVATPRSVGQDFLQPSWLWGWVVSECCPGRKAVLAESTQPLRLP